MICDLCGKKLGERDGKTFHFEGFLISCDFQRAQR